MQVKDKHTDWLIDTKLEWQDELERERERADPNHERIRRLTDDLQDIRAELAERDTEEVGEYV